MQLEAGMQLDTELQLETGKFTLCHQSSQLNLSLECNLNFELRSTIVPAIQGDHEKQLLEYLAQQFTPTKWWHDAWCIWKASEGKKNAKEMVTSTHACSIFPSIYAFNLYLVLFSPLIFSIVFGNTTMPLSVGCKGISHT